MTLSLSFDPDTGRWTIMVSAHGQPPTVAGPRILRGPPHPEVNWVHETEEGATADLEKLNTYLASVDEASTSTPTRRQGA